MLREKIIAPALAGRPPFVLSDAMPGDRLPLPAAIRLLELPAEQRKTVKRARWLSQKAFTRLQRGELPTLADLVRGSGTHEYTQLRNTIDRSSQTTTTGGGLFPTQETVLDKGTSCLTVYARVQPDFVESFWALVEELARWGFGSDRSAGKGQFRIDSKLEPVKELDVPGDANGCVVLSTFQPAAEDATDGAWEAFTKYGKLGPDFGLENVFKRPMIVLRPGACFRQRPGTGWVGRAIPMEEMLAGDVLAHFNGMGASLVHWAFGLAVPLRWPQGSDRLVEGATVDVKLEPADAKPEPADAKPEPADVKPEPALRADRQSGLSAPRPARSGPRDCQGAGTPRDRRTRTVPCARGRKAARVLAYGVPPPRDQLPQAGEDISVYRNNQDPRNPQYRWDKPTAGPRKPPGGPAGRGPRGRR